MIRKDKRRFSHVETWVFDLDNTLYPHHLNLWQQVDARIRDYIADFLAVTHDEAFRLGLGAEGDGEVAVAHGGLDRGRDAVGRPGHREAGFGEDVGDVGGRVVLVPREFRVGVDRVAQFDQAVAAAFDLGRRSFLGGLRCQSVTRHCVLHRPLPLHSVLTERVRVACASACRIARNLRELRPRCAIA